MKNDENKGVAKSVFDVSIEQMCGDLRKRGVAEDKIKEAAEQARLQNSEKPLVDLMMSQPPMQGKRP